MDEGLVSVWFLQTGRSYFCHWDLKRVAFCPETEVNMLDAIMNGLMLASQGGTCLEFPWFPTVGTWYNSKIPQERLGQDDAIMWMNNVFYIYILYIVYM